MHRIASNTFQLTLLLSLIVSHTHAADPPGVGAQVGSVFSRGLFAAAPNVACVLDSATVFACQDVSADADSSARVALGDFDGDLITDAVFANLDTFDQVCFGDGTGGFSSCTDLDTDSESRDVGVADLDGDGNLDVVIAKTDETMLVGVPNRVCLGDGTGSFTCSDVATTANRSFGVELALIDDDDDLDAVFADFDDFDQVCLGDGTGGFASCSDITATGGRTTLDVALGDLDGDGNIDAVFANFFGIHDDQICLGDGTGDFPSCSDVGGPTANPTSVILGDLDQDGVLDAVFGNVSSPRACLGDGSGALVLPCAVIPTNNVQGVALAEVDDDGRLDLVAGRSAGADQVCSGDGTGGFPLCTDLGADTGFSSGVALGSLIGTLNTGLIAHWRFDFDGRDDSGNGRDGTLEDGAVITTDARIGSGALDLRGVDGYVDVEAIDFSAVTDCSFAYWVSVDAYPGDWGGAIYSPDFGAPPVTNVRSGDQLPEIGLSLHPFGITADSTIADDDKWFHVAFTHDATTGTVTPYVNGNAETAFVGPPGAACGSNRSAMIGAWDPNGDGVPDGRFHDGRIDDLRIYGRVLSAAEVAQLSGPLFADGFESGDTSAWSATVP